MLFQVVFPLGENAKRRVTRDCDVESKEASLNFVVLNGGDKGV